MTLCSVCRGPLPTHVSLTLAHSVLEAGSLVDIPDFRKQRWEFLVLEAQSEDLF